MFSEWLSLKDHVKDKHVNYFMKVEEWLDEK
jgi:hypothetical protein